MFSFFRGATVVSLPQEKGVCVCVRAFVCVCVAKIKHKLDSVNGKPKAEAAGGLEGNTQSWLTTSREPIGNCFGHGQMLAQPRVDWTIRVR